MALPDSETVRRRLLDLFPAVTIKDSGFVDEPGKKADAIKTVVETAGSDDLTQFVAKNFGLLHQHVYLYEWDPEDRDALELEGFFDEEPIQSRVNDAEEHHYYLLDRNYDLVLDDPLEHAQLNFSWPVKIALAEDHLRVHFTIMAKSPSAHVEEGRGVIKSTPHPRESDLLDRFELTEAIAGYAQRMDINRGIKALWDGERIDADVVKYKRERATSRDVMDENFTVREDDPKLYEEVQDKPLFKSTYLLTVDSPCTEYFLADAARGHVTFRRYSSTTDCVDRVVRQIIEAN